MYLRYRRRHLPTQSYRHRQHIHHWKGPSARGTTATSEAQKTRDWRHRAKLRRNQRRGRSIP